MVLFLLPSNIFYLDKNKGTLGSRSNQVEPRHDGDEDGGNDDDGVQDHLDGQTLSLQADGGEEIDEKGAEDGETTARKDDEPEDLQHLRK